jgi:predicted O-linked N-acetylglucosamine transferase (SPINDLY family)
LAIESYRRSLDVEPDYLPSLYNLGLVLHELDRIDEAELYFRRVVAIEPGDPDALFHLGVLLFRRAQLEEAGHTFRLALRHAPDNPHLWMRLGELCITRNTPDSLNEAAQCFGRAAELQPQFSDAHFNLGYVSALQGRHDDALRSYQNALNLQPDSPACQANLLTQMQHVCDWSRFDELAALRRSNALRPDPADPLPDPFGLLSIPSTLAEQLACARVYSRSIQERAARERKEPEYRFDRGRGQGRPKQRLRIGYLSADFHEHVTAHVMAEVFELHDRSRIEAIAYSYGPDDHSPMRGRLERAFARFVDLRPFSNSAAAAAIHADQIDILVDLKGHTRDARTEIVAMRPAPIQASYMGFPATMGADFIDYIITDRFVLRAQDASCYSEQPVCLPGSYYASDRQRAIGATPARKELGLPQEGFVFCCFNQAFKILPEMFAVWMRLLDSIPGSVLWLTENNGWATDNLRREASKRGVDPARLVFAPKVAPEQYLGRLRAADLFLDTSPYNAHTTASDALWVGVPVVTCPGETLPSRVAGSQLSALGLPELIANGVAAYEALALRLARAPGELAALRDKLSRNRGTAPLFDTPRFVRNLEAAYDAMWRIHCAGDAPRLIEL